MKTSAHNYEGEFVAFGFGGAQALERHAVRPSIPHTAWLVAGLWASCACMYLFADGLSDTVLFRLCIACLVGVVSCLPLLFRGRSIMSLVVIGCLLGIACASVASIGLHQQRLLANDPPNTWTFQLLEDGRSTVHGGIAAHARATNEQGHGASVRLTINGNTIEPLDALQGTVLQATTIISEPRDTLRDSLWSKGISTSATIDAFTTIETNDVVSFVQQIRRSVITFFASCEDESVAALMSALVCGYREPLNASGMYESFKTTGLAHIVAVSGAHLALVSSFFSTMLSHTVLPRSLQIICSSGFILAFVVFAGMPLSALRAACMSLIAYGGSLAQRRNASLNGLALCVGSFIVLDPPCCVSASLFLSAGATCGIILFSRLIMTWIHGAPPWVQKVIVEPLALAVAANIFTQPFSVALFSQLPLISPLAQIVSTPLFSVACIGGVVSAVGALVVAPLSPLFNTAALLCATPLATAVHVLSLAPYASIPLALSMPVALLLTIALVVGLWCAWPQPKMRHLMGFSIALCLAVGIYIVGSPFLVGDEIIMLDVGQGDAFVIRSQGKTLLIDTGNQDTLLKKALARHGIHTLNSVAITHADDDHCGSLDAVRSVAQTEQVFVANSTLQCSCEHCQDLVNEAKHTVREDRVKGLLPGDSFSVGRFLCQVVWPQAFIDEGGNADSLCLLVSYIDTEGRPCWTALFCGDAEAAEIEQIIEIYGLRRIDILKVGHHGSKNSLNDDVVQSLQPRIALLSCGENNRYGHPAPNTLVYLQSIPCDIYRTDQQGDTTIHCDTQTLQIHTQRSREEIS